MGRQLGYSSATFVISTLLIALGCQQHHFMTEADFKHFRKQALCGTTGTDCAEMADMPHSPHKFEIRTVNSPEAQKREISLAECMAIAMQNGRTGELFDPDGSSRLSSGPTRGQQVGPSSDSMRVFLFDPAIQAIDMEESQSKYDAFFRSGMQWSKTDRPVGTAIDSFQGSFAQINAINQDNASLQAGLFKPLATGGLAGISFNTDYEFSNLNARVNPSYRPTMSLSFEQPLLRNFGVGINQLLDSHPGGIRNQVPTGGRVPSVLISRLNRDQALVEFERRVMTMAFAVERAYWSLYAAYWDLYSREIGLRQATTSWQTLETRTRAGMSTQVDLYQAQQQLQQFRDQRLSALGSGAQTSRFGGVLAAERNLRYLLNLPIEDGTRLVPIDDPTEAPILPDFSAAVKDAWANRPDLRQLRSEIQRSQMDVLRTQNSLLPDLRTFANYDVTSVGSQLDGTSAKNALKNLTHNDFQGWSVGFQFTWSPGMREAHSEVQRAKMLLAQRVAFLTDRENALESTMQGAVQEIVEKFESIKLRRARRIAAENELELRRKNFDAGRETIDIFLRTQSAWADALRDEKFAIADYNISLANFQQQKGTILEHNNIHIMEGALPEFAQAKAAEHVRQRMGALKLAEQRSGPLATQTGGSLSTIIDESMLKPPVIPTEKPSVAQPPAALSTGTPETKPVK